MHAHALVDAEGGEELVEDRHEDGTAADAEDAGEQPGDDARQRRGGGEGGDLAGAHGEAQA